MDAMQKRFAIIGVGNCGSQIAALAEKKYSMLFDTVYVNSSDADLSTVSGEGIKFKIGKEGIEGSGKNRTKMKTYLRDEIKGIIFGDDRRLIGTLKDKKYCFIVTSTAGGTGSGSTPFLMEVLRQTFPDTNFILVGVLPSLNASYLELGNTLEFLDELYRVLGDNTTYMLFDNDAVSDMPPTKGLKTVNEAVVEDLRVLTGVDNFPTPFESIDEADMESIITTPGRIVVARIKSGLTEKMMEEGNLDELVVKALKSSMHAETERDKKVIRWGIITYFTERASDLYVPTLPALANFIGQPKERFNHLAINPSKEENNFMYLIASGLSPINDRARRIRERSEELRQELSTPKSDYVFAGEEDSVKTDKERREIDHKVELSDNIDTDDIMKRFMS